MTTPPPADLLLTELTLITVDKKMAVIPDAALVVRGGRIDWLGPRSDLPKSTTASRSLALPGRVACPLTPFACRLTLPPPRPWV